MQARLNAIAKEKAPQVAPPPAAPIFNVVLPNNPYGAYPPVAQLGPAAAPPAPAPAIPLVLSSHLIPPELVPGPRMDMETFCRVYNLAGTILSRLRENAYSGTHAFPYMTGNELIALGFKIGELIDLKEAITNWATSN